MTQPLRFGVVHDLRSPPGSDTALPEIYAQALDQIEMADKLGFDQVWFTEHHFLEDGHLPNFVPVAGAVAARTSRIRISTDIMLAPFAHPVRLAEDMAILDNISGGRMELGIGMGYAAHEFRGFGIPQSRRVSLTEELVQILRLAWAGEPFSFSGKRYQFDDLLVTPARNKAVSIGLIGERGERLRPAGRAQAPAIAGGQSREADGRLRRRQVVAVGPAGLHEAGTPFRPGGEARRNLWRDNCGSPLFSERSPGQRSGFGCRSSGPKAPGNSAAAVLVSLTAQSSPPASCTSWRQRPHGVSGLPYRSATATATRRPPPVRCRSETRLHSAHKVSP